MPQWHTTVDLGDIFHASMPYPEKRDEIVRRIQAGVTRLELTHRYDWEEILLELSETETVREFDETWNSVYYLADMDRIWIATF